MGKILIKERKMNRIWRYVNGVFVTCNEDGTDIKPAGNVSYTQINGFSINVNLWPQEDDTAGFCQLPGRIEEVADYFPGLERIVAISVCLDNLIIKLKLPESGQRFFIPESALSRRVFSLRKFLLYVIVGLTVLGVLYVTRRGTTTLIIAGLVYTVLYLWAIGFTQLKKRSLSGWSDSTRISNKK